MEKNSTLWSYTTGIMTAVFGGVTLQEVALWSGILTTIATFALNWYYKAREDRRARVLLGVSK